MWDGRAPGDPEERQVFGGLDFASLLLETIMAWRLGCVVVAMTSFLTLAADQEKGTSAKQEIAKLRGIWQVTKLIEGGAQAGPADELKEFTFDFQDGLVTIQKGKGGDRRPVKFSLDPSKNPKWIDIDLEQRSPIGQGIYKLQGDELTLCIVGGGTDTPRPSEFKASQKGHSLLVLKKAKQ
ncbi:MAG TPA: TIGR03067 domain-containing protein [Gemmataceae bacterium]|nr:TIGR03067 domain-containing protein [Gemmataceae bacterium]